MSLFFHNIAKITDIFQKYSLADTIMRSFSFYSLSISYAFCILLVHYSA